MIREGKLSEVDSISELGIYGVFLRKGSKILLNEEAGHLVRTKVDFSLLLKMLKSCGGVSSQAASICIPPGCSMP